MRRKLLLSGTIICLTLMLVSPFLGAEGNAAALVDRSAQQKYSITVMTYNIQQLGFANWMANHFEKERLALIPETILALEQRPDILVLQEVFTGYSYEFLTKSLKKFFPYYTEVVGQDCESPGWTSVAGDCRQHTWKGNGGVVIFSRWPIEEKHAYVYYALHVGKSFDFLAQKGVVYARISISDEGQNQTIHVLGTHLQADRKSHDVRMLQLAEMRRWFDNFHVPASEAVILAGDFNVSSMQPVKFSELLDESRSRVTLSEGGVASISPGTNRYLNLISQGKTKKTLDLILYRSDHLSPDNKPVLEVLNFKSKRPWRGKRLFEEAVEMNDLSDHYPALMVFRFQENLGTQTQLDQ